MLVTAAILDAIWIFHFPLPSIHQRNDNLPHPIILESFGVLLHHPYPPQAVLYRLDVTQSHQDPDQSECVIEQPVGRIKLKVQQRRELESPFDAVGDLGDLCE